MFNFLKKESILKILFILLIIFCVFVTAFIFRKNPHNVSYNTAYKYQFINNNGNLDYKIVMPNRRIKDNQMIIVKNREVWADNQLGNFTLLAISGFAYFPSDGVVIPQKDIFVTIDGDKFRADKFDYIIKRSFESDVTYDIRFSLSLLNWRKKYIEDTKLIVHWVSSEELERIKSDIVR